MATTEIRVAIAGLGTVGTAVIRLLQEEGARYREEVGVPLRLVAVLDRSHRRKDTSWLGPHVKMTDSLNEFLAAPSDIVVELIGGIDPADQIITTRQAWPMVVSVSCAHARTGPRSVAEVL